MTHPFHGTPFLYLLHPTNPSLKPGDLLKSTSGFLGSLPCDSDLGPLFLFAQLQFFEVKLGESFISLLYFSGRFFFHVQLQNQKSWRNLIQAVFLNEPSYAKGHCWLYWKLEQLRSASLSQPSKNHPPFCSSNSSIFQQAKRGWM